MGLTYPLEEHLQQCQRNLSFNLMSKLLLLRFYRTSDKKLDSNCSKMLQGILDKSSKQNPTKQLLYSYLPLISKTIQIRWTKHAGHSWKSKGELISDILLWTPSHSRAGVGHPARTSLQRLCIDTGYSLEDLLNVMDDRDKRQGRVREIHARMMLIMMTIYIYLNCIYIYIYIWTYIYINAYV